MTAARLHLPHEARGDVRRPRLRAARGHCGGCRLRHDPRIGSHAGRCAHAILGRGLPVPIKGAEAFARGKTESVEGIEAVDDHTLRITLEAPATTFLLGLTVATSWPVPAEAVKERGDDFASRPVGAGPFYLQEWNEGSDITLTRNPGYVDPELPYLDEIHIDLGIDESTQVARLQAGEADGTMEQFALSPTSLQLLEQDPGLTTVPSAGPRVFYLALNNDGILADKRLRQAVAQAMTSDFTAQFGGIAQPWNQFISSTTAQSAPEATTTYVHDPEVAAALLESADYDGTPIKIVYDVTDPYGSASATALRQDLEAVGFTVSLDALQRSQFLKDIYDPADFDVSPIYWSADYPDAQDFIATNFVCGSIGLLNISRFCDEDIDTAFAGTERMPFGPERDAALLEAPAAAHRRTGRHPGHGNHAAGRFWATRWRPAHAGHICPLRLEASLGEGS